MNILAQDFAMSKSVSEPDMNMHSSHPLPLSLLKTTKFLREPSARKPQKGGWKLNIAKLILNFN